MEIAALNQAINIIDPPKDAAVDWKKDDKSFRLTAGIHGDFMKTQVLAPLFNPGGVQLPQEIIRAPGVGDSKELLKKMILTAERLGVMNTNKQELVRLSRSASGSDDTRLKEVFLAYDCGPRPQDLASSHKVVLTPGAILDRATRDMSFKDKIVLLTEPSEFSPELLKDLNMDGTIKSLVYNGKVGTKYRFTIKTTIPGYEEKNIDYTSTFQPDSSEARACSNENKNEYIYDHYTEPSKISYIKFIVLLKELGDTLQVLWLKQFIGTQGMSADKTAIATQDLVVWLRSLINGVSCVITEKKGALTTLYPVLNSAEQIQVANIFMKEQLLKTLEANNKSVVQCVHDCIKSISAGGIFTNLTIAEEYPPLIVVALVRVLKSIYVVLKQRAEDILTEVRAIQAGDINEFRKLIDDRMMKKQPFYVGKSTRFCLEYGAFLPKAAAKLPVRLNYLQQLCAQEEPNENTLKLILGYNGASVGAFTLLLQEEADAVQLPQQGGMRQRGRQRGGSRMTKENMTRILNQNMHIPGFLTSFLMTNIPELFYMGYAYDTAYGKAYAKRVIYEDYDKLLNVGPADKFSHLLDFDDLQYMQVDEEALARNRVYAAEQDKLTRNVCITLSRASVHSGKEAGTLFDVIGEEVLWIIEWFIRKKIFATESAKRVTTDKTIPDLHWTALRLYDVLYNNEVSLCIRNLRGKPTKFGKLMIDAVKEMREATKLTKFNEMVEIPEPIPPRVERLQTKKRKPSRGSTSRSMSGSLSGSISAGISGVVRTPNRTKRTKRT